MREMKTVVYISIALGMLLYAVPKLDLGSGLRGSSLFAVVWICFAMLVLSAHLHHILGVDEETKQELKRIKKYRRWRMQQMIERRMLKSK